MCVAMNFVGHAGMLSAHSLNRTKIEEIGKCHLDIKSVDVDSLASYEYVYIIGYWRQVEITCYKWQVMTGYSPISMFHSKKI